jgi:hypothetical protein
MKIETNEEHAGLLKVTITNLNEPSLSVRFRSSELDYKVRLTSEDGRQVDRTEHGKELLDPNFYQGGSRFRIRLKPGGSRSETLDLRTLFDLKPGRYKVVLSRDVGTSASEVTLEATGSFSLP